MTVVFGEKLMAGSDRMRQTIHRTEQRAQGAIPRAEIRCGLCLHETVSHEKELLKALREAQWRKAQGHARSGAGAFSGNG